jgi:CRP-like cAMP-binding protein
MAFPHSPAATADELTRYSLFRSTPAADLQALARVLQVRTFPLPGELVFERGDRGDAMFLIRQGQVRIFIRDDQDNEVTFRFYGPGQAIGEFSLIDGQPRSASADAYDGAQVLVLDRSDFLAVLRDHPMIGIEMMRDLAERIRYTTRFLERVLGAVELLQSQNYDRALQEMSIEASDDQMQAMVATFVEMVQAVQARRAGPQEPQAGASGQTQRT